MQALQPLIQEISEKYKDDPIQKMTEIRKASKGASFFSLLLPIFIQAPIFIAMFGTLRHMSTNFPDFTTGKHFHCSTSLRISLISNARGSRVVHGPYHRRSNLPFAFIFERRHALQYGGYHVHELPIRIYPTQIHESHQCAFLLFHLLATHRKHFLFSPRLFFCQNFCFFFHENSVLLFIGLRPTVILFSRSLLSALHK